MGVLAADTWGVSGPAFLGLYLIAMVIALVLSVVLRRMLVSQTGTEDFRSGSLTAPELGMLISDQRAVLAALTVLRDYKLINGDGSVSDDSRNLTSRSVDGFSRAVYALMARGKRGLTPLQVDLQPQLSQMRESLVARGLMLGDADRRTMRAAALPMWLILALGVARVVAGIANERPVAFLIVLVILFAILTLSTTRVFGNGRLTRAGRRELELASRAQRAAPSRESFARAMPAVAVALSGVGVFWMLDAELASAAEVPMRSVGWDGGGSSMTSGDGCSGSSCSSSSCSSSSCSSSSCGGSSGCGG